MCVSGIDNTDGTWHKRQTDRLLGNSGPFYGTMMKWDCYLHILCYLHFTDNRNEPDRTDENSDRLWKIRDLFEILNATISKFYNPSENLAIVEVIFSFKGRVIFKQCIPKKTQVFQRQNFQTL